MAQLKNYIIMNKMYFFKLTSIFYIYFFKVLLDSFCSPNIKVAHLQFLQTYPVTLAISIKDDNVVEK